MELLVDLFGYLSIVLHGLTILAQSVAVGGVVFITLLARPLAPRLAAGPELLARAARIAMQGAAALTLCEAAVIALQGAVLNGTVGLDLGTIIGAEFAMAGLAKIVAAALLGLLLGRGARHPAVLLPPALAIIAAAIATTHAAARLDGRGPLLVAEALHIAGAAIWIGGLPCFLMALRRVQDGAGWRLVGARYSRISMLGVACILASGSVMAITYIGSIAGFYGTAYGVMVGAKIALFAALLGLGYGNFRLVERLRTNPATPVLRLKRFAEVELGLGIAVFMAAASLTSVPPAVDLPNDRATWAQIVDRNTPEWPRLASPEHDRLALPALQAQLDAAAAQRSGQAQAAFIPGAGQIAPRNAEDIAWSEYNHHWAGIFVLLIGLLALLNHAGLAWAKHWPLLFLALAGFLFFRSDPEAWPMGEIGFWTSLRDVEVLQHRMFVVLIIAFAVFEWRVRLGRMRARWPQLVFPLITAAGGTLLLTHSHAIANLVDQLLIEVTHTPLALAGIAAGWARWLELRADGRTARIGGWVWPVCFLLVGLILLDYREA